MPLSAQRFKDNHTLRRCIDDGYRMQAGERDKEAVKRLQLALKDLGYRRIGRIDGIWGTLTSNAVVQFKTDEQLRPTDAVASRGTIGQLDMYYEGEAADPDQPDPSADGLEELARATAEEAGAICEKAVAALATVNWGGPPRDLEEEQLRSAVVTHTGIDARSSAADMTERRAELLARIEELVTAVTPATSSLVYEGLDRPTWHTRFGHSFYWAFDKERGDQNLYLTPPFRNVLSDVDRIGILLHAASQNVEPATATLGYPGTRHYSNMSEFDQRNNSIGIHSVILFAGAGISTYLRPFESWGDLSSMGS